MRLKPEDLRQHYASLSDDALTAMDRNDLVEAAQKIYDEEVARRGLKIEPEAEQAYEADSEIERPVPAVTHELNVDADPPDWIENAACACTFSSNSPAPQSDAIDGFATLTDAGIPCHVTMNVDETLESPSYEFGLMVPGALYLHATSILDRDFFNVRQEADWRVHLEWLSDADLKALNPEIFCAGFLDRAARLKRAYKDELARRKIE